MRESLDSVVQVVSNQIIMSAVPAVDTLISHRVSIHLEMTEGWEVIILVLQEVLEAVSHQD